MTPEQIKKLCEVDPEHFIDPWEVGAICWWMFTQMPAGTFCSWQPNINDFACNVRTKEGWDVGVHGARGFGATREEAVINAYISWKQATKEQV